MNARRLPTRNSAPSGIHANPSRLGEITVDRLILNLPGRVRKHPGYNETVLRQTAEKTLARLASCSSPNHGQGDIAVEIAANVERQLQTHAVQAPTASGPAVGFLFEGIALTLLRMFAEMVARRMLAWAWNKMAGG